MIFLSLFLLFQMKNSCFWSAVALVAIALCLEVVKGKKIVIVTVIVCRSPVKKRGENSHFVSHSMKDASRKAILVSLSINLSFMLAMPKNLHLTPLKQYFSLAGTPQVAFITILVGLKLSYHKANCNQSIDRLINQSIN